MSYPPTFDEVEAFVQDFAALRPKVITPDSRLEADFGITGDDGDEFLQKITVHFDVQLAHPVYGYRSTFALRKDEYLFHSEGFDTFGIGELIRRLRKQPRPRYRDLTLGELHNAILRATPKP